MMSLACGIWERNNTYNNNYILYWNTHLICSLEEAKDKIIAAIKFLLLLVFRFIECLAVWALVWALTFMRQCVCVCVLVLVCLPCSPLFDCLDLSTVAAPHSLRVSCTLICSWPPSPLALLCLSLIVFLSLSFACFHFVFEQKFASAY